MFSEKYGYGHERYKQIVWEGFGGFSCWARSFQGFHIFTSLPTAIAWEKIHRGDWGQDPLKTLSSFKWYVKWWIGLMGWLMSMLQLTGAGLLFGLYFEVIGRRQTKAARIVAVVFGSLILLWELLWWILYYAGRKNAYRYARYLYDTR